MAGKGEPPSLPIGTDVSAKYKGAFCEAKVKKVAKQVKVKVSLQDGPGQLVVMDEDIIGPVKVGAAVMVKPSDSSEPVHGTIVKVIDQSMYTVIFDDGDENTLRRTQLCLMGEKHFVKSETLDDLPLSHPEHFSTPVVKSGKRHHGEGSDSDSDLDGSDEDWDSDDGSSSRGGGSSTRGSSRRSRRPQSYTARQAELLGRVLCMEMEDRKRSGMWVPMLVVRPCVDETVELKSREHLLVKSFKDSKFFTVHRRDTKDFTRKMAMENDDKALKGAYEKALLYFDTKELPQNWDREELLGSDSEETESDSSDDEPCEEKDRFVAQLYKFMDDRGTPINKGPQVAARDLNLYRLFRLVQNLGGYNKVTNQVKWTIVHRKMGLPSSANAVNQLKTAYNKYLYAFENFYRKLGNAMGTINRPSRSRHTPGRNLVSFRERESPKSPRVKKANEDDDAKSIGGDSVKSETKSEPPLSVVKPGKSPAAAERKKEDSETESETGRKVRTRGAAAGGEKKKAEEEKPKEGKKVKEEVIKPKEEKRGTRGGSREESEKEEKEETPKKKVAKRKPIEEEEEKERKGVRKKGGTKEERNDEEDEADSEDSEDEGKERKSRGSRSEEPFEVGTKLKVKYGRGKNQKIYEAKIMEVEEQGGTPTYLVHYAGWNNRYNEWIKRDRVVAVAEDPRKSTESKSNNIQKTSPAIKTNKLAAAVKAKAMMQIKKRGRPLGSAKSDTSSTDSKSEETPVKTLPKPAKPTPPPPVAREPSPVPPAPPTPSLTPSSKAPRPTRSTSMDANLSSGLPNTGLRRMRKSSGVGEPTEAPNKDETDEKSETESSSSSSESEEEEEVDHKRTTRSAAAQMAKSDEPIEGQRAAEVKSENKDKSDMLKVKDMTQSLKDANRAREVSSKVKEVAKFKEVASKLKEVASKVKEHNSKVKEVTSKIKEEVTKEEESSLMRMEEEIRKEKVTEKASTQESQKTGEIEEVAEDERVSDPGVKDEVQNEVKVEGEETQGAEPQEVHKPTKGSKKKEVVGRAKRETEVEVKEELEQSAIEDPKDEDMVDVSKSEDAEKSGKKRGSKAKAAPGSAPKSKAGPSGGSKSEPETPPRKRGPKPKRKLGPAEDLTDKSQADSEPETPRPKKKMRRKKEVEEKVKEEKAALSEGDAEGKSPDSRVLQNAIDKYAFAEEESPAEPKPLPSSTPPTAPTAPPVPPTPTAAPELVSIEARRSSAEVSREELPLPQLSPQIPVSVSSEHRRLPFPVPAFALPVSVPSTSTEAPPTDPPISEVAPPIEPKPSPPDNSEASTSQSKVLMDNTPPETPEGSPQMPEPPEASPSREDSLSTESEREANMEVEKLMGPPAGGESPSACDTSTISNGSGGSSGNAPGSESDDVAPAHKRKAEEEEEPLEKPAPKRRRRGGHKRGGTGEKAAKKASSKPPLSDSDENTNDTSTTSKPQPSPARGSVTPTQNIVSSDRKSDSHLLNSKTHPASSSSESSNTHSRPRVCKYNFLDFEDGKYLEGEDRIAYLMGKIQDLRKIYMGLKAEVACIDRRRKRHRRKEREAAQAAAFAAAQAAVDAVASQEHVVVNHHGNQ